MPVRLPPLTEQSARLLLEDLIDYAGLFPPAQLSMAAAVRNFAHYRAGGHGWMLGRFVCSASMLKTFSETADPLLPRDDGAIPWRIAVTGSGNVTSDMEAIAAFNERHRVCFNECGAIADSYETKAASVKEVEYLHSAVPENLLTYIELPLDDRVDELVAAVASVGRRAKMRLGGVSANAFPQTARVAAFLRACLDHQVTSKATAGLHHPLSGPYRLTYEDDAPTGRMFGFVNLLLSAAIMVNGGSNADAERMLETSHSDALHVGEAAVVVSIPGGSSVHIDRSIVQHVRHQVVVSIGSCSFTEPVHESTELGWI